MQITKLTENGKANQVAISPDGRYIVYAMRDGEKQSLWVRNVATKSDVQVLAPDVVEIPGLSFSPDGNYIYFVRSDKSTENFRYLYQMPVLGGSPRQLIRDIDSSIDFSPDGSHFVFERGVPDRSVIEVWIAQADGSGERLVATLPAYAGFIFGATWSPDGNTLAASTLGVGSDASWQLNAINVADGRVRTLFSGGGRGIGRAVWMPDGNSLIARGRRKPRSAGANCKASTIPRASCIALPTISRTTPRPWMSPAMARPWLPFSVLACSTSGLRRQRIHLKPAN